MIEKSICDFLLPAFDSSGVFAVSMYKRPSPEHLRERAEIYINNDVTVMKVGNKVYKATPEKGECLDVEKGILVCIAKYCGFSTTDILKLVEKANIQKTKKVVKSNKKKK